MDIVSEQKDALVALGLTALGFVILVVTTASHEYGLILMRDDRLIWSLTRIVPALAWISLAGVLVLFRNTITWKSAAAAFMVTLVIASTVAVAGAPLGVNAVSVMSTVSYYALTSALLCVTIRSAVLASFVAPVFLVLQVITDILAHLGTGVVQLGL